MRNVQEICDVASEAGVVASVALNPELVFYSEQLTPHHFTVESNGYLYYAISELAKRDISTIDSYNITNILNANATTREKTSTLLPIPAINEFLENAPLIARSSPEEYRMLAKNVMNAAFRRNTYQRLQECQNLCFDYQEDDIEQKIYGTLDDVMMEYSVNSDMPQYKDVIDDMWEQIRARQSGETDAIEFPFKTLNRYVVLEPGEAVCVCAPQKTGKSAMLLTCTVDMLKKNKAVLYIDSEISTKLFTLRILSHLTKISFGRLRSGLYGEEDEKRILAAKEWLKTKRFIHIYLPVFDENTMYLAAKKAKHLIDVDCIVVDYLKSDGKNDQAYENYNALGRMANTLKNRIAGEMGICALTAAQATATGRIADSAKIARYVSTVISITDKTIDEVENDGTGATKKMRVQFNRNGAQMNENEWIDMCFDGSTVTYSEAPVQHVMETPY